MAALLIITQPLQRIVPYLPQLLAAASPHVSKTLYIHLDESCWQNSSSENSLAFRTYVISSIYSLCYNMDIRVLMGGFKKYKEIPSFKNPVDKVLMDFENVAKEDYQTIASHKPLVLLSAENVSQLNPDCTKVSLDDEDIEYDDVVLGGTFDGIHPGHKIFLSSALLRTRKRLTVGFANGPLLKNKTLKELIAPCEERIEKLREFLLDIDRNVGYNLVEITDPMGPTSWDPKMEMIVVSEETKVAVPSINSHREAKNLNLLKQYCIPLYEDCGHQLAEEEDKFSSSSLRMRRLGTRIRPVVRNDSIPAKPHIIGLTGGSASGKSQIAKRLQLLGAAIIDCDKMGHLAYEKGTQCYGKVVENFGKDILADDGKIDRKKLGAIVFKNPAKLQELNGIVWPSIAALVEAQIETHRRDGKEVVVLDAAVLLKSGWDAVCHEVWVTVLPRSESVRRIVERDGVSEEIANKRLDQQLTGEELVSKANIVFCSQWSYETTRKQVEKAWEILKREGFVSDTPSSL